MMELWGAIEQRPGRLATLTIYYRRDGAPPEERSRVILDHEVFTDTDAASAFLREYGHKWRTCFDG